MAYRFKYETALTEKCGFMPDEMDYSIQCNIRSSLIAHWRNQLETEGVYNPTIECGPWRPVQMEDEMTKLFSARLINMAAAMLAGALMLVAAGASGAQAANSLVARISIANQTMDVMIDGHTAFQWKVSTARKGYVTPTGSFKPTRMHEMWYSRKYDNAPMPHSVFFHGGYAVHATNVIKRLGRPASHGCIRLHPDNASNFYELVESIGPANTSIIIVK